MRLAERWLQRLHQSALEAHRHSPSSVVDCDRCVASRVDAGTTDDAGSTAGSDGLDKTDRHDVDRQSDVECRSTPAHSPPPPPDSGVSTTPSVSAGPTPGGGGHRRRRTAFTSDQLLELEKEFHSKKYLSLTERSMIARQLRLSEVQVEPSQ